MFGDFILWFKEKLKQSTCIHDYRHAWFTPNVLICKKCGRGKNG